MTSNNPLSGSPVLPTAPEGWRRTDRPMKIAILGWAWLSLQGREGSGYNLNASDLAAGLALSGHKVFYLRSGMDYSLRRGMWVKKIEQWRGVSCFHLYNSPNLSPASSNFRNMEREISSPEQSDVVLRWLDQIGAEVVHIHSLEGFGLDLIPAIRASGRPVVVTAHNHWYVCPQVDLLHEELRVCDDYDGGRRCVGCIDAPRPHRRRMLRSLQQGSYELFGGFWPSIVMQLKGHLKGWIKRRGDRGPKIPWTAMPDALAVDRELALGYEGVGASGGSRIDHGFERVDVSKAPKVGRADWDTNEKFLAGKTHLVVLNNYGERRLAGVQSLNHASAVTPPSKFVLETLHAMGLKRELGRHVLLGQPHFDQLHRRAMRSPFYAQRPWNPKTATGPLRLAFMGTTRNNKGIEVLVRAIEGLEPAVRERCQFYVRASGTDWAMRKRLSFFPEVALGGGYDILQLISAAGEFDVGILPHIWFENSPLVLLEMLHAGKFVLASRLGGPPEWIVPPGQDAEHPFGNGVLFSGGHHEALAAHITALVRGEIEIPSPREVHAATRGLQSYPGHIAEVESIYVDVLRGRDRKSEAPRGVAPSAAGGTVGEVPDAVGSGV